MEIPAQILQFFGSLAAIFALAGLAWWLKLGGGTMLEDDVAARFAATQVADGFEPEMVAVDHNGQGALLRDGGGQIMALKPHGRHFAGRILGRGARADLSGQDNPTRITVITGERQFGNITLDITQARTWAEAINALSLPNDA